MTLYILVPNPLFSRGHRRIRMSPLSGFCDVTKKLVVGEELPTFEVLWDYNIAQASRSHSAFADGSYRPRPNRSSVYENKSLLQTCVHKSKLVRSCESNTFSNSQPSTSGPIGQFRFCAIEESQKRLRQAACNDGENCGSDSRLFYSRISARYILSASLDNSGRM